MVGLVPALKHTPTPKPITHTNIRAGSIPVTKELIEVAAHREDWQEFKEAMIDIYARTNPLFPSDYAKRFRQ